MVSLSKHSKEIFYSGSVFVFLLFIVLGNFYPATDPGDKVPFGENGDYDRGKLTSWFAFIFFSISVLILGKSLYSTFLKMEMSEWNLFAFGTFLLFIYGLGGIFQSVFDHALFDMIKDLILPIGLLCMLYSTFRIYEPFDEEED